VLGEANFFADVEHGCFVAFAFADDDGAIHFELIHCFAHGFDGDFVGFVAIAETHGAGGGDGGIFDYAQEFKAKLFFHIGALRGR
jgi:hypothetical protein